MQAPSPLPAAPRGSPLTLTVAETARWLRVSKSSVYDLVHRWLASGGADGLPTVKLGLDRTLRIPTVAVLRLVGLDVSLDSRVEPGATADGLPKYAPASVGGSGAAR